MKYGQRLRLAAAVLLIVCLVLGAPLAAYAGENDMLSEVRALLKDKYVEQVSDDVLNAPTIKEMLQKLGDRNTQYFTKAEYDQFLNTLNREFSGIGIELEQVPEGIQVTKVMEGYGAAKAGMKPGDMITEAGGNSFAGKTSEYCVSILRGPEGTKITVKVKRGTEILSMELERMVITLPLVEGKVLDGHIGYIALYSFGTDTVSQFNAQAQALMKQGADSWIIDLRNNGGGYTQAALDLLGYFIGDKHALITTDRSILAIVYNATKQNYTLQGPIVLLTNAYTGSSSEITTGAMKDHNAATMIGETTYGSGCVKALMPLSNGDYLKMTVNKFYSPNFNAIDKIGISPHIDLSGVDELKTAEMMLKDSNQDVSQKDTGDKSGYIRLDAGPNHFAVSAEELRKQENWAFGKKILDSAYVTTTLKLGGANGWEAFPEEYLNERFKIYYPGYIQAGDLRGISPDKKFTVSFNQEMDWGSVQAGSIELINSSTGERTKCTYDFTDKKTVRVTPESKLQADTEYWLVVHPTIKDAQGRNITGGVALAKTAE
ncbi:MAG: Carboxy-terminal processing protease CtpB [Candidatus Dichloromethanomonas elyunquensis]|nr:MAG: Carboxy-terminal processing protease CtpB [Candidatus Dichloromethanomonas elyunquensis]